MKKESFKTDFDLDRLKPGLQKDGSTVVLYRHKKGPNKGKPRKAVITSKDKSEKIIIDKPGKIATVSHKVGNAQVSKGLEHGAPAVITNAIPGEKGNYDEFTGQHFGSRGEYEAYYKNNDLTDMYQRDLGVPPSEAELPSRPRGCTTFGTVGAYDPSAGPPNPVVQRGKNGQLTITTDKGVKQRQWEESSQRKKLVEVTRKRRSNDD